MGDNLVYKILKSHVDEGEIKVGEPIALKIDQTLTQDSTGTMAYLQLEAMGIDRVKTKKSVAFIDHNMLQQGFENADDHKFIQTVASKYGVYFSKPGNGICHQIFLERFSTPGDTLIGSDSHTPTPGGVGMLAMGAGGLDVALAMGGGAYNINTPKVVKIELIGKLNKMVAAKDVILEVLRILKPIIKEHIIIELDDTRIVKKEELQKTIKQLSIKNKDTIKIEENEDYLVFGSFLVVEKFLSLIGFNEFL